MSFFIALALTLVSMTMSAQCYTKSQQEAWLQKAIRNVMQSTTAIKPGTPYANHFLVAAMLHCGMNSEAKKYVEDYWGGMVRLGADTFWEYYVPDNHLFSSYNGYTLLNSYCHAWSCTPIYFIVNYPEIFQK